MCSAGKVAARGASIVEYLIQIFYKRLNALGFENKQVSNHLGKLGIMTCWSNSLIDACKRIYDEVFPFIIPSNLHAASLLTFTACAT